jgi:hypothetical protein
VSGLQAASLGPLPLPPRRAACADSVDSVYGDGGGGGAYGDGVLSFAVVPAGKGLEGYHRRYRL